MDVTDEGDLSFLRQRRNWMAISLVLLFVNFADVKINAIQIFDAKVEIGKPEAVFYALWFIWAYFGWRYWQLFKKDTRWNEVKQKYLDHFRGSLCARGIEQLRRKFPDGVPPATFNFQRLGPLKYETSYAMMLHIKDANVRKEEEPISRPRALFFHAWSWIKVAFVNVEFSDYVVPLIVGFLAPVLWIISRVCGI